jgi:hypothetical protein
MAEYCSQCTPFKKRRMYDIDLFAIARELERGYSTSFLCEGCNNRALYKDEQGLLYLVKAEDDDLKFYTELLENL